MNIYKGYLSKKKDKREIAEHDEKMKQMKIEDRVMAIWNSDIDAVEKEMKDKKDNKKK